MLPPAPCKQRARHAYAVRARATSLVKTYVESAQLSQRPHQPHGSPMR